MAYAREAEQAASVPRQQQRRPEDPPSAAWQGWLGFAGIIMIMIGIFGAIEGFVALFREQYFLTAKDGLIVVVNYSSWGWVHLALGVLVAATGFGVLAGMMWARVLGVVFAVLNATLNLAFLKAYPVWSSIVIALDVIVIYALMVHGREMKSDEIRL